MSRGPLHGVKVIELAGLGPAPFCGMMLADMGADVVHVGRIAEQGNAALDWSLRNRRSLRLNLKSPKAVQVLLELIESADILIEGFRPGVTERLGLGPDVCLAKNPRLVYGRVTGWGQSGPLAHTAGHDINYIALSGALHLIGNQGGKPVVPMNLVGDFGAGGMLLAFGVLAALTEARSSGRGQVVDAAMVDGTVALLNLYFAFRHLGMAREAPGEDFLAGAAPWYDTYVAKDGKFLAVGALEQPFFVQLLEKLGLDVQRYAVLGYPAVDDATRQGWPELRAAMTASFATRTRDEWCAIFDGTDACVAPVLAVGEAARHPHNAARETFVRVDGVEQNAPAPRFSGTPAGAIRAPRPPGADTDNILRDLGHDEAAIHVLRQAKVVG